MMRPLFDPEFEEIAFPQVRDFLAEVFQEQGSISSERRQALTEVARYVGRQLKTEGMAKLVFICTHNSRRSHFGQVWAQVAGAAFGLKGLETYSGGTAVTAFNSRAAAALGRAGLRIHRPEGSNPAYEVAWSGRRPALICYSKIYDDNTNPRNGFAALMTCTEADRACPLVPGAEERFGLPYTDPKSADGTPAETGKYDERCREIGRDMVFLCAMARELLNPTAQTP